MESLSMTTTENSGPTLVDLLPAKQRQAMTLVFGDEFTSRPMGPIAFIDDAKLCSPTSINFYRREFPFISRVLSYEYQYRSWYGFDQELLNRYGEMISKKLVSITTLITNWNERFGTLLASNGVKMESAVYTNAIEITVPIISGHARAYFLILKELDKLYLIAGTANLMGVISSTQRADAEFICKKAVRAFGAALRNEVNRLYREADRLMREQHGIVDKSRQETIAVQGKELQAFGESMDRDSAADTSLSLGNADPGQIIDDATAAAVAANKAEGRPRSKKAESAKAEAPAPTGASSPA